MPLKTLLTSGLVVVVLVLVGAAPAAAATTYRASISGTYTTTGTVTSTRCESGPMTGEAKETASFHTTRPAKISVQRLGSSYPAVALLDDDRPVRAQATVTRTSTLDRGEPRGCTSPPKQQDCGKRQLAFDVGFGSRGGGVATDLSKNGFGRPALFSACSTTTGMMGFPTFADGSGSARVSAKRLLAGRRLVLRGGRLHSDREEGGGITSSGGYDLSYTITLTPVRG